METIRVIDEENIGSNLPHMKKVAGNSAPNIRKKSFIADNAENKLEKTVRTALTDLINVRKAEASELKPSLSSKQSPHVEISKSADQISDPEEEEWSDIEEMHNYEEPEDDYEDIFPKHERLSSLDIDNLWFPKSAFNQLSLSPEHPPDAFLDSYRTLSPPKMTHDEPFLTCDFFGGEEMKFIPLSLDYSD